VVLVVEVVVVVDAAVEAPVLLAVSVVVPLIVPAELLVPVVLPAALPVDVSFVPVPVVPELVGGSLDTGMRDAEVARRPRLVLEPDEVRSTSPPEVPVLPRLSRTLPERGMQGTPLLPIPVLPVAPEPVVPALDDVLPMPLVEPVEPIEPLEPEAPLAPDPLVPLVPLVPLIPALEPEPFTPVWQYVLAPEARPVVSRPVPVPVPLVVCAAAPVTAPTPSATMTPAICTRVIREVMLAPPVLQALVSPVGGERVGRDQATTAKQRMRLAPCTTHIVAGACMGRNAHARGT
jgi:hypothetical protein